jgi:hypothetical protein
MSTLSEMMIADFRTMLAEGGIALTWAAPSGEVVEFLAMVEDMESETRETRPTPANDMAGSLKLLLADATSATNERPKAGVTFKDAETGEVYFQIKHAVPIVGTPFWRFRYELKI